MSLYVHKILYSTINQYSNTSNNPRFLRIFLRISRLFYYRNCLCSEMRWWISHHFIWAPTCSRSLVKEAGSNINGTQRLILDLPNKQNPFQKLSQIFYEADFPAFQSSRGSYQIYWYFGIGINCILNYIYNFLEQVHINALLLIFLSSTQCSERHYNRSQSFLWCSEQWCHF